MEAIIERAIFINGTVEKGRDGKTDKEFTYGRVQFIPADGKSAENLTADTTIDFDSIPPLSRVNLVIQIHEYNRQKKIKVRQIIPVK